jgi:hypothetical protein
MSNSQNPARGNDAHQQQQPPQYTEQPRIELHDSESAGTSSQPHAQPEHDLPPATRTKSEASSYAGSYRPSDGQTPAELVSSSATAVTC